MDNKDHINKRGRPRSEKSHRAVLDATLRLVEEYGSASSVTMESIARTAGVGKQTLYKWWSGTGDIYLEILREIADQEIVISDLTPGKELETFLSNTFIALKPVTRLILKALMVEAIIDKKFREKFVQELIVSRRQALSQVIKLSKGSNFDNQNLIIDLIFGLMWYRLLLDVGELDAEEARRIAQFIED